MREDSGVTMVETARGPVPASDLGRTLMHEHVFVLTADVQQNYPDEWGDEDVRVADAVRRLSELPEHGIGTIVDVTAIGQGRNIPRVKRIADQVPGLNIVVATGIYTFDEVPMFFWRRHREAMTELFVRDITEGIAGTGVKAGMLKCAVDEKGLTQGVERVLRSVAQAHAQTGTPVTIHTHAAGQHGPAILEVLKQEGADLDRVVLGHSGDATDSPDYLESMVAGRAHPRHGPVRHRPLRHVPGPLGPGRRAVPPRPRGPHGAVPRHLLLHRLVRARLARRPHAVALPARQPGRAAVPARARASPRTRSTRCWSATRPASSRARRTKRVSPGPARW